MHPFSILTLAIFVAGYITARWDLVTRLYELAIFAVDHGVLVSHDGRLRVYQLIAPSLDAHVERLRYSISRFLPLHPTTRASGRLGKLCGEFYRNERCRFRGS